MNYKRKRARTRPRRHGNKVAFPRGMPLWFNIEFHVRPRRRRDRERLRQVMLGADPDALLWEQHSRKPTIYYW